MSDSTALSAAKRALLERRLKGGVAAQPGLQQIPRRRDPAFAPLSSAQRQMWVLDQIAPGNPACHLPYGYRIRGPLDVAGLEAAFKAIVRRHEALRTTFGFRDGEPIQRIHPESTIRIAVTSLAHLPQAERDARLHAFASEESVLPFDLSRLPLVRVCLFELSETEHVLLVNMHHLVADGLSIGVLRSELDVLYGAARAGRTAQLPELPLQYGDYACWEQSGGNSALYQRQIAFWQRTLDSFPRLELPADHARPPRKSFRGSNVFFELPSSLARELNAFAAREQGTAFMALLTAFQALLHRHSRVDEFVVLTPVGSRSPEEVAPLIGHFVNLVALRCDASADPTFTELMRRSRDLTLDAFSHGDVPFERVLEHLTLGGGDPRVARFPVMLQLLPAAPARLGGLEVRNFHFDRGFAQLDLALHLYQEPDGGYVGRFEYCTDLFRRETVEDFCSGFEQLLCAMLADPHRRLSAIAALPGEERSRRAIRDPQPPPRTIQTHVLTPPRTKTEEKVLAAFRDVLKRSDFGVLESFFDLGGHSLAAARLVLQLRRIWGIDLPLRFLFERPSVERLAEAVDLLTWQANARQLPASAGERVEIEL